jgi:3-mercaptopyruvate sulfurtransferase SseA
MSRIFIVEYPRHDIADLERLGRVFEIWPPGTSRPSVWDTDRLTEETIRKFNRLGFKPEEDALAYVGSGVLVATTLAALVGHYGRVQVVLFDNKNQKYIARTLGVTNGQAATNSACS